VIGRRLGRGGRPLRIAYGRIFHEANTYSPVTTEAGDFERMHLLEGAALARAASLRGAELASFMPHAELTGFVQAARAAGGVTAVPLSSALAVPGGPLSTACFEWLLGGLLDRLRAAGPVDGVYLALHGSMEVRGLGEAPEAVILRRVREVIGGEAGLAVSYDLHGNLSAGLVDPVDVLVAYRTNPHWDLAPTGFRAGNRLIRALRGQIRPIHAWRKLPVVLGGGMTISFLAPMRGVFRFMRRLERDPRVVSASLFMVHPYTGADDLGWAVHVSTDGDRALADRLADQIADRAWAQRGAPLPPMRSVDEALGGAMPARSRWSTWTTSSAPGRRAATRTWSPRWPETIAASAPSSRSTTRRRWRRPGRCRSASRRRWSCAAPPATSSRR
jgi:microcystin degradation protein MlrC